METVAKGKIVTVTYQVWDSEGELVDSSSEPFDYRHGVGQIVQGLESALDGKQVGDVVETTVPPEQAYGEHNNDFVLDLPKHMFPPDVEVGMMLQLTAPQGEPATVWVTEIEEEKVTVDGNHPMAGQTLQFKVEVLGIKDAPAEEG